VNDIRRDRVLILENDDFALEMYARHLKRAGFQPTQASGLLPAFDALERELFSVCVVDLNLDDPRTHGTYEGSKLLYACAELDEGTNCVIASGQDSPSTASELTKRYSPYTYIEKGQLSGGVEILISAVRSAAEAADLDRNLSSENIYSQLFGQRGQDSFIAESRIVQFLSPKGGSATLRRSASFALAPLLPLREATGGSAFWHTDPESGVASKEFWSKGLGRGLELSLSRVEFPDVPDLLFKGAGSGFYAAAREVTRERSAFEGLLPASVRGVAGL
jgi:ActR/RegA family two-component response regulator